MYASISSRLSCLIVRPLRLVLLLGLGAGPLVMSSVVIELLGPKAISAQEARPTDVSSIDAIIEAYYDVISGPAGEPADVVRDHSLHHPDAWVAIAGVDETGKPNVNVMSLDDYHGDGGVRPAPFYEWETGREVQQSGNMVHVWSHYASSREPGGEPFDTGTNSITLFWDGDRWWVMGWMFDATAN
ncbi:MAG: hypothetical protein ACPGPI_01885 [Longimicrobiales bacterium]